MASSWGSSVAFTVSTVFSTRGQPTGLLAFANIGAVFSSKSEPSLNGLITLDLCLCSFFQVFPDPLSVFFDTFLDGETGLSPSADKDSRLTMSPAGPRFLFKATGSSLTPGVGLTNPGRRILSNMWALVSFWQL